MASIDFESERSAFRDYYNDHALKLQDAATFFCSITNAILRETDIEIDAVTARVKDREECIAKFSRKYREKLEETGTPYAIRDWIPILIGVRVVCLYEPDVYRVEEIFRANFDRVDVTDKKRQLEESESLFGYKGVHLDLRMGSARERFAEYTRYRTLQFEAQIRTISQDAWSTLDHKIKYKKNIPLPLKRRINRLAALFELADQEFTLIRDLAKSEMERGEQLATSLPEALPSVPLDVFGFLGVAKRYFPTFPFLEERADGFLQELLPLFPELTTSRLAEIFENNLSAIGAYRLTIPHRLNPFTEMRHALFMADPVRLGPLLFPSQRGMFEEWLRHRQPNSGGSPPQMRVVAT